MSVENETLASACMALVDRLAGSRNRLASGEVFYQQHAEFAERAWSLHMYLRAALELLDTTLYPQAFGVLRSAMEHHLVDHLLFLGNRFVERISQVSEDTLAEWQRQLDAGEAALDIVEFRRKGTDVEIVRTGSHYTDQGAGAEAPTLSAYYGILDRYDPFLVSREIAQDHIGVWPHSREGRARNVARQRGLWFGSLTWGALVSGIALNGFYSGEECVRWHIHYGFLSAFVHPASARATHAVYGRNYTSIHQDHYCEELVLLYVATIARLELHAFDEMADREPRVGLPDRDEVAVEISTAQALCQYLWFPSGPPPMFDRVAEANRRGTTPDGRLLARSERPEPSALLDDEVAYYENPLKRLIEFHSGIDELTGFQWQSPWPRADAWQRRID